MAGNKSPSSCGEPFSGGSSTGRPQEEPTPARPFDPTEFLARVWQQNLPVMRARVAALEGASKEAVSGALTPATRTTACDEAHKLAGSLGMFGFPRGTEIAREFEAALENDRDPDPALLLSLTSELRVILPL